MDEAAQEEPQSHAATRRSAVDGQPTTRPADTASEPKTPKLAELANFAESIEAREKSHLFESLTAAVGMIAASVGAGAVAASGGAEVIGGVVAFLGIFGSILPLIGRLIARNHREYYTDFSDIQDPVVRELFEATAAEQIARPTQTQVPSKQGAQPS